ncbi:haloacid dehalogenase [Virgibacillus pantothenticus]|uniref:HAD family hydrolase n=1 Tax=Virgibacillus pantothenticus TaxID=1473 RepID=UPI001B167148|nr:HAD family hydrolase [Virgibacillus pantothenticus]MBU8566384.1 HAD family hydrolase [Virgibacillus pantothenticus]MBU8600200.1 HAD family hydrolase [Virgibacillus pantothenticus]MBU8633868.1 HAD family hydrolase [Virgibacillus pantothenticus]MBU8641860.1 HAD family hydrolase [Virgibacillus pantothenticus]MBU8645644.1 HAD family hydrolase [Virgibacillus pantothenticus]
MTIIAFDLDDTLYDRTLPLQKTFQEFTATKQFKFSQLYPVYQKYSDIGFEQVARKQSSLEQSHVFRIRETLREFNIGIDKQEALLFQTMYKNNQEKISLRPHIAEILRYLQQRGIQLLIITNGPSLHQRKKVRTLGLDAYFTDKEIIVSEEEGTAKPDRKIFNRAEERFQFSKQDAWYIGDNYPIDMVGAHQAGWSAVWLNLLNLTKQTPANDSNIATKTVYSTEELKHYLFHLLP